MDSCTGRVSVPIRHRNTICCDRTRDACSLLGHHKILAGLQHFHVATDHNPLIPILNTRWLDEVENPRLQRLKSRLMGDNFTARWTKGSSHSAPDALSRNPVSNPCTEDSLAEYDTQQNPEISMAEIRAISTSSEPLVTTRLQDLQEKAANDPEYQQLREIILKGFPDH